MAELPSTTDERFYTPRAQASTARSTGSYGTPRSYRSSIASSSSDGEYATPRNAVHQHSGINVPRPDRRHLIPPHHHYPNQEFVYGSHNNHQFTNNFGFDQVKGDEENLGQGQFRSLGREDLNFRQMIKPSKNDIESVFSFTRHGRIEEVDNILTRGIPPDVRDDNGNTVLAVACQNGNKRLVKLALRRGADINASNLRGNTPLHFCYKYGNIELGQYIITKGADKKIRNLDGHTCEDLLNMTF